MYACIYKFSRTVLLVTFRTIFELVSFTNYFINCKSTKLHGIIQETFSLNISLF